MVLTKLIFVACDGLQYVKVDGLVQDYVNCSALAVEFPQLCTYTKPLECSHGLCCLIMIILWISNEPGYV